MEKLEELLNLNVNAFTEKKNGLTYLSWANAWKEFLKVYPTAKYEIKKDNHGVPCFGNDAIGYMVYTTVTVDELTHEMWLPVMDNFNKSMKTVEYQYKTRNGNKTVQPMTMFDVNKAVMRCLTKNLAMFGLGLYIYAGEDLPENNNNTSREPDIRQQINNALNHPNVNADSKAKYIDDLKSGKLPVNQSTLDKICMENNI